MFGVGSKLFFEFGSIVFAWIAFGWPVGVALLLWYFLWTWTGWVLAEESMRRLNEKLNEQIRKFKEAKTKNPLRSRANRMKDSLPPEAELEKLTRYEGSLERQFYKALNQLERVQRMRAGDKIPAPIALNLEVNE